MDAFSAPCKTAYTAHYHGGRRAIKDIKWIVLHSTEGGTAESNARYFADKRYKTGSAHLCVDDKTCFKSLKPTVIAYAAPGANTNGFHIEMAGFARWSLTQWKARIKTIKRAAYKTAVYSKLCDIPLVWVDAKGLKAGKKGITLHRTASKAFGGNHTDPGLFFPKTLFIYWARKFRRELDV